MCVFYEHRPIVVSGKRWSKPIELCVDGFIQHDPKVAALTKVVPEPGIRRYHFRYSVKLSKQLERQFIANKERSL